MANDIVEQRVAKTCRTCGSENVQADAYVQWDKELQCWEIANIFDKGAVCEDCDGETRIVEVPVGRVAESHKAANA